MGIFDRISQILRAEVNSRSSRSRHNMNAQTRELEQKAISLRQQIADLEATDLDSMNATARQEYSTTVSSLKRSLATLEQAILDLVGTIDVSTDNVGLDASKVSLGKPQVLPKTKRELKHRADNIDAELEAIKRDLDDL